ncbi:helix-turn-helix domain-containing protein [Enterococcus crotali]|uniref:helix-turn-helix domain-containing protein n=1 Tax=Enterococcus crotali TaxID=1453587 RepID=UPI0004720DCA|nr:helix-turn-helix transcriptional regulator [Enterococcus crotali]
MTVEIGKQIKKFRQEQEISQQELAEHLNISRQTISKWELGKSLPDLEKVIRLSEYFNISVDVLLGRKKPGFFRGLFDGKERRQSFMDQSKEGKNSTAFSSAYVQDIQPLFSEGKRVNTFIKIEEELFPKATFSKLMGYANCLCGFNSETVSIDQIGKFKLAVNIPVEQSIATFPLIEIVEINLQFRKYFRNVGGNFVTLIDIVTKDQSYYFWVESLSVAHAIWHHELFSSVRINVDKVFQKALDLENQEEAVEGIRDKAENIPLFYGTAQ